MKISERDRAILRELANRQMTLAHSERNLQNQKEWYRHNRFEKGRPMIHLELGTFVHEIIPKRLRCETEIGRQIETTMYGMILNSELFDDDRVVPDFFPIYWRTYFNLFDQQIQVTHASNGTGSNLGHQFQHIVTDLKEDWEKYRPSSYGIDKEGTLKYKDLVEDVIGDILPAKMQMGGLYAVPTQKLVHMMGMENFLFSIYDYPDLFKEIMNRGAEDYINYYNWLENEGLLLSTTAHENLGQGTWCYTEELPNKVSGAFKTKDVWGYMDSQESVGISPDMFHEFIFPSYEKISKTYGLLSYGCCEPVDAIWEQSISKLTNLRKVSISPWCDETYMGEQLRDKKVIYHRKPSPNFLGVTANLDEAALRQHIRKTLTAARGCQLEITQRDVYTIHDNEKKAKRFIEIIREEIENSW